MNVNTMPELSEVMDVAKLFVKSSQLHLGRAFTEHHGVIETHTGNTFNVEVVEGSEGIQPHIALWNEVRAISFDSIAELRGWLRYDRSIAR